MALDGELVDGEPFVVGRGYPVDKAHEVTASLAILLILNGHAADQQLVEVAVGGELYGDAQVFDLLKRILAGG